MLVSIVIPCYRSEKTIRKVVELSMDVFEGLPDYECEFLLVDDCSPDNTYEAIKGLAADYPCVHGYTLMRNFGQHNGIMCGLNHAHGDVVMGMDDDLQTHPSQIPAILAKLAEGYDVVYGTFPQSKNGVIKNFTSWLNRVSAEIMLNRPKDLRTSSFWAITAQVKDQVIQYKNYNPYVEALFGRMTNKIGNVAIEHHEREEGTSGYTLSKLIKLWLAYFNYTVLPLRVVSGVGAFTAAFGFLFGVITIIHKLLVPDTAAGWTSLLCTMLFFFGLILLALGIIGEYLGDIVLSVNSTPQYIVRESVNDAEDED